jgi:hypothetical protein
MQRLNAVVITGPHGHWVELGGGAAAQEWSEAGEISRGRQPGPAVGLRSPWTDKRPGLYELAGIRNLPRKGATLRSLGNLLIRREISAVCLASSQSLHADRSRILPGYGKWWYKWFGPSWLQRVLWRARPEAKGSETNSGNKGFLTSLHVLL